MSRRKDKRSPAERKRDRLVLSLTGAIVSILSLVIQDVVKQEANRR